MEGTKIGPHGPGVNGAPDGLATVVPPRRSGTARAGPAMIDERSLSHCDVLGWTPEAPAARPHG